VPLSPSRRLENGWTVSKGDVMKRVLIAIVAVGVLLAAVVAAPVPASAATGCSKSWHIITHGETGLNVRPSIGADGSRPVYVDGVPGTDYWNQQFLFCRDPGWAVGQYALYSNMTGGYCYAGSQVDCAFPSIEDSHYLFQVFKYDSTWWTIKTVEPHFPQLERFYQPDRSRPWLPMPLVANYGALTGNHLFRITPSNLLG
jgi:hypothetical protein